MKNNDLAKYFIKNIFFSSEDADSKDLNRENLIIKSIEEIFNNGYQIQPCPDQVVATIEITYDKVIFKENYIDKDERNGNELNKYNIPTIALVLESPADSEYDNTKTNTNVSYSNPIGPACGKTGINIEKYLLGNIAKYIKINNLNENGAYYKSSSEITEGLYKLVLINSIQYPCNIVKKEKTIEDIKDNLEKKYQICLLRTVQ